MTSLQTSLQPLRPCAAAQPSTHWLAATSSTLRRWLQRIRGRDVLSGLDERMLKDIGLTRADVTVEVDKPFWRA